MGESPDLLLRIEDKQVIANVEQLRFRKFTSQKSGVIWV